VERLFTRVCGERRRGGRRRLSEFNCGSIYLYCRRRGPPGGLAESRFSRKSLNGGDLGLSRRAVTGFRADPIFSAIQRKRLKTKPVGDHKSGRAPGSRQFGRRVGDGAVPGLH